MSAERPGPPGATVLDPMTLPLHGSRLIEASAGTGKTWTIAALYLRLVLGHGDEQTAPPVSPGSGTRALLPAEILVMTFTRAATRELSDRIRARLDEAARCFRGDAEPDPDDGFLQALMAAYPAGPLRQQAAYRLALAAEAMDDAAVHTIDAWCRRMLEEHAFDSAQWFDEELVADEHELRTLALQDFWRREVVPLRGAVLDAVLEVWPSPEALREQVAPLVDGVDRLPAVALSGPLPQGLPAWLDARDAQLQALKAGWSGRADEMARWFASLPSGKADPFHRGRLKPASVARWLDQIRAWAGDPGATPLVLKPDTGLEALTPDGLRARLRSGQSIDPIPEVFAAFEALGVALAELPPLAPLLRTVAAQRLAGLLSELKQRQGCFGFADLQVRLQRALDGPQGERLRERIRACLPVALIDEFQDTSPLQYRLFDRLYGVAADDPASGLLLIGDPKQAIYGFRGADIYSYLRARADTAGRHQMLDTNFRSTAAMVAAVNTVFAAAEAGFDGGAFLFGKGRARSLPFEPVRARGRAERLQRDGSDWPALRCVRLPEPLPAERLRRELARHAAAQLVDWLNDPAVGFATPAAQPGAAPGWRRLAPGDVAVLVRSRREAEVLRAELRRRGVASVYLSDQESVFASPEAEDLLRWLQAVAEPLDAERVRDAWATRLAGLDLAAMAALLNDESAWETRVALLQRLRGVWQRQGPLTLVRQSLHALDLPARCLAPAALDGERRLTNLLHLGELLQQAADRLDGEQALLRWLAEEIARSAQGASEDRVMRLESDAQLVQVVTVHKSKGLEYPVVMLPFAASGRPVDRRLQRQVECVDEDSGARRIDLTMSDEALEQADRERLREDLRLMYVALTRARHAVWLGLGLQAQGRRREGGANRLHHSALGYLLGGGQVLTPAQVAAALEHWVAQAPAAIVHDTVTRPAARNRLDRGEPPRPLGPALRKAEGFDRRWSIGSFSALVRDLGAGSEAVAPAAALATPVVRSSADDARPPDVGLPGADAVRQERLAELMLVDRMSAEVGAPESGVPMPASDPEGRSSGATAGAPWHLFPRGALAGHFLHDLLEALVDEGFEALDEPAWRQRLRGRCERAGHGERAEGVLAWLDTIVSTPLPPLGVPLRGIGRRLPEMEFWMPSTALDVEALDAICRAWAYPGQPRPALVPRVLEGLLMGFADLVFEHEGRWWVLDYKSNALASPDAADPDAAYHAEALADAMRTHRYDLQAGLYLLALHRLLRLRLGATYDPAQHLGGAVYVFLRGMRGPAAGCAFLPATPAAIAAFDAALAPPTRATP